MSKRIRLRYFNKNGMLAYEEWVRVDISDLFEFLKKDIHAYRKYRGYYCLVEDGGDGKPPFVPSRLYRPLC
jgi:hypothetical protein